MNDFDEENNFLDEEAQASQKPANELKTTRKRWAGIAGKVLLFAAVVAAVSTLAIELGPTSRNEGKTGYSIINEGVEAPPRLSRLELKGLKQVQVVNVTEETTVYAMDYRLEWVAEASLGCDIPVSGFEAWCSEGSILTVVREVEVNYLACTQGGNGAEPLYCDPTSGGQILVRCSSDDREKLALSASWHGASVMCAENGTVTRKVDILPSCNGALQDINDDICSPSAPENEEEGASPYCGSTTECEAGKSCDLPGTTIATVGVTPLIDNECIYPIASRGWLGWELRQEFLTPSESACSPNPCEEGQTCTEADGGGFSCERPTLDPCLSNPCDAGEICVVEEVGGGYTCDIKEDIFATDYVVMWKSRGAGRAVMTWFQEQCYGCEEPLPAMVATCGGNGRLLVYEDEIADHDCWHINEHTVECTEQKEGTLPLRCETGVEGSQEDLVLTVSLPEDNLKCDGFIDLVSTRGGDAFQQIFMFTRCNDDWVALEDDCQGITLSETHGHLYCETNTQCECSYFECTECYADLGATEVTTVGPLQNDAGCIYKLIN